MCAKLISNRPRAANLNGAFCSNEEKELTYSDFTFYTCFEGDVTSVPAKSNGSGSDKVPCLELSDKLSDILIRDVDVMYMSVPGWDANLQQPAIRWMMDIPLAITRWLLRGFVVPITTMVMGLPRYPSRTWWQSATMAMKWAATS